MGPRGGFQRRPAVECLEARRLLAIGMPGIDAPSNEIGARDGTTNPLAAWSNPSGETDVLAEGEFDTTSARQPIILLPGLLGSLPQEDLASWLRFDDAAMHPENLEIDPIQRTYDDLIASLVAAGYNDGSQPGMRTLWTAPYDWRLAVAPRDGQTDGHVETDQVDPTDEEWEFGIEYVDYWIEQAWAEWQAWEADPIEFAVDLVGHSMGGLLGRSYLQSDLFQPGEIDQLLMLGTPNHGAVGAYQAGEWGNDPLSLIPELAVDQIATQLDGMGPTGALMGTTLVAGAHVLNSPSVESYAPSLADLLPTFEFISRVWPHKWLQGIDDNTLLADINHSYDYEAHGVRAHVLYGTGLETDYEVYHPLGFELLQLWTYDNLPAGHGDSTVLASSAILPRVPGTALERVEHVALAGADVRAQQAIFELLELVDPVNGFASGAYRSLLAGLAEWSGQRLDALVGGDDLAEFSQRHWSSTLEQLIARTDHYAAFENETLTISAAEGLLANDARSQDRKIVAELVNTPSYGKLELSSDGGFTYTPPRSFNREDSFHYRLADADETSDPVTVRITVATEYPWHNGLAPLDVNADNFFSPVDALWVIDSLNNEGSRILPLQRSRPLDRPFVDTNRDGVVSAMDALLVIHHLNTRKAEEAEGERPAARRGPTSAGDVVPIAMSATTITPTLASERVGFVVERSTAPMPRFPLTGQRVTSELASNFKHPQTADRSVGDLAEILAEVADELENLSGPWWNEWR